MTTRLLVYHPGALGDLVLTFPALSLLRGAFGIIDGVCQGRLGLLARHLRMFDRAFSLEAAPFSALFTEERNPRWVRLLAPYDAILVFSQNRSLDGMFRRRTGRPVHGVPLRPEPDRSVHVADAIGMHLAKCGLLPENAVTPSLTPENGPRRAGRREGPVRIHPGSGSRRKNWPLDRFMAVGDALALRGMAVEYILGPAEEDTAPGPGRRTFRPESPPELAELLSDGAGFLGNDSGVTHLAAYLGLPTVAVFGPSDPVRWRPLGPSVTVVAPSRETCRPCFETDPENCGSESCLQALSVESVLSAVLQSLSS